MTKQDLIAAVGAYISEHGPKVGALTAMKDAREIVAAACRNHGGCTAQPSWSMRPYLTGEGWRRNA